MLLLALVLLAVTVVLLLLIPSREVEQQDVKTETLPQQESETPEQEKEEAAPEEPTVYEADGCELLYGDYRLLVGFDNYDGELGVSELERTFSPVSGVDALAPSLLFVYSADGQRAWPRFYQEVDHWSLELEPLSENAWMDTEEPTWQTVCPDADLTAMLRYDETSGSNKVVWTLTMKNGDILKLFHVFHVKPLEVVVYHYEERDLETLDQLNALLEEVNTLPPETMVDIFLPPVVYEGGLDVKRAVNLYGALDPENPTTFTGHVDMSSETPAQSCWQNICFRGHGSGAGLLATKSIRLLNCDFRNWEIGLAATEWCWADVQNCTFEDNEIGWQWNLQGYRYNNLTQSGNLFVGNEIGLKIGHIPGEETLVMVQCVFRDNEYDIQNEYDYPLDTSLSVFE